jgi:hypothetical protein
MPGKEKTFTWTSPVGYLRSSLSVYVVPVRGVYVITSPVISIPATPDSFISANKSAIVTRVDWARDDEFGRHVCHSSP